MWTVSMEKAETQNPNSEGKNLNGVVIYIKRTDTSETYEVTRVAFVRRHGAHPKTPFARQARRELEKAQAAADLMNEVNAQTEAAKLEAKERKVENAERINDLEAEIVALRKNFLDNQERVS